MKFLVLISSIGQVIKFMNLFQEYFLRVFCYISKLNFYLIHIAQTKYCWIFYIIMNNIYYFRSSLLI